VQIKGQHAIHTTAARIIPAIEVKPDEWAAIVWMCQNQLGRRSITEEQRAFLIGQEYEAQKKSVCNPEGKNQYTEVSDGNLHQPNPKVRKNNKTRIMVAKTHGISEWAVQSAVEFTHGLDAAEAVSPGIKDAVLTGEVKVTKAAVAAVANCSKFQKIILIF